MPYGDKKSYSFFKMKKSPYKKNGKHGTSETILSSRPKSKELKKLLSRKKIEKFTEKYTKKIQDLLKTGK